MQEIRLFGQGPFGVFLFTDPCRYDIFFANWMTLKVFASGLVNVYRGAMKDMNGPDLLLFEENCK